MVGQPELDAQGSRKIRRLAGALGWLEADLLGGLFRRLVEPVSQGFYHADHAYRAVGLEDHGKRDLTLNSQSASLLCVDRGWLGEYLDGLELRGRGYPRLRRGGLGDWVCLRETTRCHSGAPGAAPSATHAAARDPAAVIEALVTRAGTRWRNVRKSVGFAAALAMPRLNRLISIDAGLSELGFYYDVDKYPFLALAHEGVDWPSHVRSGADSVAAAARFLMLYQPIGAAAFLRGQMERWTNNRATTIGLDRHEGETHAHFIDRVWAGAWTSFMLRPASRALRA